MNSKTAIKGVVFGALVITFSGCATTRPPQAPPAPSPMATSLDVANCDQQCIKADRDAFLRQLERRLARNEGRSIPNERSYSRWSGLAIGAGLTGGVTALLLPHSNDKKNAATVSSLVAGAISGWLAAKQYEKTAARFAACVEATSSSINTFGTSYSDAFLPETVPAREAYRQIKVQINDQLNKICPL